MQFIQPQEAMCPGRTGPCGRSTAGVWLNPNLPPGRYEQPCWRDGTPTGTMTARCRSSVIINKGINTTRYWQEGPETDRQATRVCRRQWTTVVGVWPPPGSAPALVYTMLRRWCPIPMLQLLGPTRLYMAWQPVIYGLCFCCGTNPVPDSMLICRSSTGPLRREGTYGWECL